MEWKWRELWDVALELSMYVTSPEEFPPQIHRFFPAQIKGQYVHQIREELIFFYINRILFLIIVLIKKFVFYYKIHFVN